MTDKAMVTALEEIASMADWQIGVPVDTEAANEHAMIAEKMADIARAALSAALAQAEQPVADVDPWTIIDKLRIQHSQEIHDVWMPLVAELRQQIALSHGAEAVEPEQKPLGYVREPGLRSLAEGNHTTLYPKQIPAHGYTIPVYASPSKIEAGENTAETAAPVTDVTGADLVAKIAQVASGVGFQANVPALDIAGQILSILAANPEHIDRFMVEGTELFLDGTFNYENGSLTYRAMNGSILSPSVLRQKNGSQQ